MVPCSNRNTGRMKTSSPRHFASFEYLVGDDPDQGLVVKNKEAPHSKRGKTQFISVNSAGIVEGVRPDEIGCFGS